MPKYNNVGSGSLALEERPFRTQQSDIRKTSPARPPIPMHHQIWNRFVACRIRHEYNLSAVIFRLPCQPFASWQRVNKNGHIQSSTLEQPLHLSSKGIIEGN